MDKVDGVLFVLKWFKVIELCCFLCCVELARYIFVIRRVGFFCEVLFRTSVTPNIQ